jgi:hypothetical protein
VVTAPPESANRLLENSAEDGPMADHKPGEMNITEQERTFEGFMKWMTWGIAIILVALVLLGFING